MVYPLRGESVTIGRGPENTIQIIDTRMSRQHVNLEYSENAWSVRDMQSKNGAFVNDEPIAGKIRLVPGDILQCGDTALVFESELTQTTGFEDGELTTGAVNLEPASETLQTSHMLEFPEDVTGIPIGNRESEPLGTDTQLRSIYEVGRLIQSFLELDELLEQVLDIARQVLEPDQAVIFLHDAKEGGMVPKAVYNVRGKDSNTTVSSTILELAMENRVGVVMTDCSTDIRLASAESVVRQRIQSAICAPLMSKGQILGALYIDTRQLGNAYSASHLEWVVGVAAQAGLGITAALVYAKRVRERERERELEIAREIQMNLLPKEMPKIDQFEFGGVSEPAHMVGGDYYDIKELATGGIALSIADVSGKGIPAAMLVSAVRSAVRSESRDMSEDGVEEVMRRINEITCEETMSNMFVSMVLAHFNPESRRLVCCNAGHVHPIIRLPDGEIVQLEAGGYFLGIEPDQSVEQRSVELPPGSLAVFLTDGITEAHSPDKEQYGVERTLEFVQANHYRGAQEFCNRLRSEVMTFQDGAQQFDDLTVMALKAL